MNKYITFREEDSNGDLQYYILQREFPHYIGVISLIPVPEALCCIPISGYWMFIVFSGTLKGNYVPGFRTVQQDIELVFNDMALWYYSERILKKEKKYRKFKIINNGK